LEADRAFSRVCGADSDRSDDVLIIGLAIQTVLLFIYLALSDRSRIATILAAWRVSYGREHAIRDDASRRGDFSKAGLRCSPASWARSPRSSGSSPSRSPVVSMP
jgi:hypothetical protein